MRYVGVASAVTVMLTLAAGAESDDISELKKRLAIVEERLDRLEAYRVVDKYVCTDEYEQALDYATARDYGYATAVPELWNGEPFVVDISSTFPNAYELLDVIADEAEKTRTALGYEVFVAGDVLPLKTVTGLVDRVSGGTITIESVHQFLPPGQHIEIRCCDARLGKAGWASVSTRVAALENDAFQSRHIIMHELYHLLGFVHPGGLPGVVMSHSLMRGPGLTPFGAAIPTQPSPLDLARLSCIYSATKETRESYAQLTTQHNPHPEANEEPCETNGTGEMTLYATATRGDIAVYIDRRLAGSLSGYYLVGGPDCGAPSDTDGNWVTETVKAGIHTVSATASDGTTWAGGEVNVEACGCHEVNFREGSP